LKDKAFLKYLDNEYLLNSYKFEVSEVERYATEERFGNYKKLTKEKLEARTDFFGGFSGLSYDDLRARIKSRDEGLAIPEINYRIKFSKQTPGKFVLDNLGKTSSLHFSQNPSEFSSYSIYRKKKHNAPIGRKDIRYLYGTNFTSFVNEKILLPEIQENLVDWGSDHLDIEKVIKFKQIFWYTILKTFDYNLLAFPIYTEYLYLLGIDKRSDIALTENFINKVQGSEDFQYYYSDEWIKNFVDIAKNIDKDALMALYFFKLIEFLPYELAIWIIDDPFILPYGNLNRFFNNIFSKPKSKKYKLQLEESTVRKFNKIKKKFLHLELDESISNQSIKETNQFEENNFINQNIYNVEFKKSKDSELDAVLHLLNSVSRLNLDEMKKVANNKQFDATYDLTRMSRLTKIL